MPDHRQMAPTMRTLQPLIDIDSALSIFLILFSANIAELRTLDPCIINPYEIYTS
jgi:hypothetical protein